MSRRHRKLRLSRQTGGFPPGDDPTLPALMAPLSQRCSRRFEPLVLNRVDAAERRRTGVEVVLPCTADAWPDHGGQSSFEVVLDDFDGDEVTDFQRYDSGGDLDHIRSPMAGTRTGLVRMPGVPR